MKNILLLILICCLSLSNRAQEQMNPSSRISGKAIKLPGFVTSPYFEEQVISFIHTPGIKVHINAPAETKFGKDKPTKLVLYALPNGNSTDWTIGKMPAEGDDWHYHIQHIGAQTRYIRASDPECNFITVYLEADTKSWGTYTGSKD